MSITFNHQGENWKDQKEKEFALRLEQAAKRSPPKYDTDAELVAKRRRIEEHQERNCDELADLGW